MAKLGEQPSQASNYVDISDAIEFSLDGPRPVTASPYINSENVAQGILGNGDRVVSIKRGNIGIGGLHLRNVRAASQPILPDGNSCHSRSIFRSGDIFFQRRNGLERQSASYFDTSGGAVVAYVVHTESSSLIDYKVRILPHLDEQTLKNIHTFYGGLTARDQVAAGYNIMGLAPLFEITSDGIVFGGEDDPVLAISDKGVFTIDKSLTASLNDPDKYPTRIGLLLGDTVLNNGDSSLAVQLYAALWLKTHDFQEISEGVRAAISQPIVNEDSLREFLDYSLTVSVRS